MKILLINQFFWPDTAATSQLLTDLARGLSELGHDVHVVCGSAFYASADQSECPPVQIHRSPTLPFRRSRAGRVLSYLSFLTTATVRGLSSQRFDIAVTLTTPPLLPLLGTILKRLRGTAHFIWEMDVYPDLAIDLNFISRNGLLATTIGTIADFARRHADGVLVLGSDMKQRLIERDIPESQLFVAHNWADSRLISEQPFPWRQELTVLYSGNLGLAHEFDTIFGAISHFRHDRRFRFVFSGGGTRKKDLEVRCEEIRTSNTEFRDYCKRSDLAKSLGAGDIGLVTQRECCAGSVVPSKVYGLMAAGRPILYIGPRDTTPAQIIETHDCGWQIDVGNVNALVELLETLEARRGEIHAAGRRAREAFLQNYDLPRGVAQICEVIGAAQPAAVPVVEREVSRTVGSLPL